MFRSFFPVLAALVVLGVLPCPSWAGPDRFVGDTAIYSGAALNLRPNVLLLIDNSDAANETAAGAPYDRRYTYPNHGYQPWSIYVAGQQGEFKPNGIVLSNLTPRMENLQCSNNREIIRRTLLTKGTYAGTGTADYPNIKNAQCDLNPKGQTYALGNYLNYTKTPPPVPIVRGTDGMDYRLIKAHTAATDNRPASGANWSQYWIANMPDGTNQSSGLGQEWLPGLDYSLTGSSQIKIIFDAVKQVVGGLRTGINFGAMVYGPNNKGGVVIYPVSDLTNDTDYVAFLNKLPGSGHPDSVGTLSSQTARPQSEALYDAGYYFHGQNLPISGQAALPSPIQKWCDINHIILITNGLSNESVPSPVQNIRLYQDGKPSNPVTAGGGAPTGDLDGDGAEAIAYGEGTHYLDDVAKWLFETDAFDDATFEDMQIVRTHTILAFQADDPLVKQASDASHGRGRYYNVYNANELAEALTELLSTIFDERDSAFVAPVVPSSPENRTASGQRLYLGFFMPRNAQTWVGNLKKYGLNDQNAIFGFDKTQTQVDATDTNGDFLATVYSYWTDWTSVDPNSANPDGDGGDVDEGGVGGVLKRRNIIPPLATDPMWKASQARHIYTYSPSSGQTDLTNTANRFDTDNTTYVNNATRLGVADAVEREKLIRWIHGLNAYNDPEEDQDGDGKRDWFMGDVLHSKPLILNYNRFDVNTDEGTCPTNNDWSATGASNKTVVFVGSNDGMFHAFRDCDGQELFAFIPPDLLGNMQYLRQLAHTYFVDGSPVVYVHDANNDGEIAQNGDDKVVLIFGTRRGGGSDDLQYTGARGYYYALDVTNPNQPKFMGALSNQTTGFSELGEPWSTPRLAKIKVGGKKLVAAFFGAGYDNYEDLRFGGTQYYPVATQLLLSTTDFDDPVSTGTGDSRVNPKGRGVYAIELAEMKDVSGTLVPDFTNFGRKIWGYTFADNAAMKYSFPADVRLADTNLDGYSDRVYAGDTGGQIWRFGIGDDNISNWTARRIFNANAGGDGTLGRKIFYRPALTILDYHTVGLHFATGDRAHPLNYKSGAVVDRLYFLRDYDVTYDQNNHNTARTASDVFDEDDLIDVTANQLQQDTSGTLTQAQQDDLRKALLTGKDPVTGTPNYGWYIKLDDATTNHEGEKALAPATVFGGKAFFPTYQPNPHTLTVDPCKPGNLGTSRLYAVDMFTGEAVFDFVTDTSTTDEFGEAQDTSNNVRAAIKDEDGNVKYVLRRADRTLKLGEGIPTEPRVVIGKDGQVDMIINKGDNQFDNISLPGEGTIHPLYWMQW